jgi:hypothetical protein
VTVAVNMLAQKHMGMRDREREALGAMKMNSNIPAAVQSLIGCVE